MKVDPRYEIRQTDEGMAIRCLYLDPMDIEFVPIALMDPMERRQDATVRKSTVLILVPTGTFGCLMFDPAGMQVDGRWVFRERNTMTPNDVLELWKAKMSDRSALLPAPSAFPHRIR